MSVNIPLNSGNLSFEGKGWHDHEHQPPFIYTIARVECKSHLIYKIYLFVQTNLNSSTEFVNSSQQIFVYPNNL